MSNERSIQPQMRRTRFVCISDTHNQTPKLPKGDVLIHAGDLTNQGSLTELQKTVAWLERADFEAKIVVAGNHDVTLDAGFFDIYGSSWRYPEPQNAEECQKLFLESPSITYLKHESATVYLDSPGGPHTQFNVFGSPYSPVIDNWAFQYEGKDADDLWNMIPLHTDVVVTHTPPKGHCDITSNVGMSGCEALRKALWRVRPLMAVFGHVHQGRGVERVRWNLESGVEFQEKSTEIWTDPGNGNNKESRVDLTAKGRHPIVNAAAQAPRHFSSLSAIHRSGDQAGSTQNDSASPMEREMSNQNEQGKRHLIRRIASQPDVEAVGMDMTRLGGRETCMVNAAFMAGGRGGGPKRFNKPIVVDIDLPVW